ncbi:MAG: MaoC/PaaZ C-terminal domain-containing protein [Blastocatellia bacterium]
MGKYFEQYTPGEETITPTRTITETDIVQFAGLTGDWYELHTSVEYAATTQFGQRIAHGALIFSISTGLIMRMDAGPKTVIAFYGIDRLRFVKPTFIGDTIHVRQRVEDKTERDAHSGVVTSLTEVINQRGEIVISYTSKALIKRQA